MTTNKLIILTNLLAFVGFGVNSEALNDHTATYKFASTAAKIAWPANSFDEQFSRTNSQFLGRFDVEDLDVERPVSVPLQNFSAHGRITLAVRSSGTQNGVAHFYSIENGSKTSAILTFQADGENFYLRPVTDTVINNKVRQPQHNKSTLKASRDFTVLFQFELPSDVAQETQIQNAQLSLFLTARQSGSSQFDLILLPPSSPPGKARLDGIASRYRGDQGIAEAPEVFHANNFDKQSLLDKLALRLGVKDSIWDNTNELQYIDHKSVQHFLPLEGRSLLVPFRTDRNLATNLDYLFLRHHGFEPEEAYFRYYLKVSPRAKVSGGGKFPGFGGTYNKAGWGGRANNGSNGWSARGSFFATVSETNSQWFNRLPIGSYLYEIDNKNRYGQTTPWGHPLSALEPGKWYSLEQRLKLNTPGKANGILQVWVDGHEIFHRQDMNFRNTDKLKIEKIWFNFYFGGTEKPDKNFNLFADNFVIASSYIGPVQQ